MTATEAKHIVDRYYVAYRVALNLWRNVPENFKLAPGKLITVEANENTANKIHDAIDIWVVDQGVPRSSFIVGPILNEELPNDYLIFEWRGTTCSPTSP